MLIKKLIDAGICFAVVQSYSFLTRAKIMTNQEWEIIACYSDYSVLKKLGFEKKQEDSSIPRQHRNPEGIVSLELRLEGISEFKKFLNEKNSPFIRVLGSEDGVVYELKSNSLSRKHRKNESKKQRTQRTATA